MIITLISTLSHAPGAACLARSLKETQDEHQTVLCLVERNASSISPIEAEFSTLVLGSEVGIPDFDKFVFAHTAFEACMALKAQILLWAMDNYPKEELFVYLDSDMYAYGKFAEIPPALEYADILLTPHHVQDEDTIEGTADNMIRTLACGIFNTGFLALRRSPASRAFLEWWTSKLRRFCYHDASAGLFYEQKWLDLAPSFFDVSVFREPGYNVANWNISRRHLAASGADYLVNGRPLRLFHYSMVNSGKDVYYFTKYSAPDSPVLEMRKRYLQAVNAFDLGGLSKKPWSYGCFSSGEAISDDVRRKVRNVPMLLELFPDPFHASNSDLAFPTRTLPR